ncbi:hypothetical protein MUG84_17160 [Paenibacillus sp. KQZ6P-2]|uniref:VOC domain-containing protein n=1 Tax=Paenibacillus mangrovi TaxID=2931978 RepID=A0A9X2B644_9BACL|nr:hypothetical protein [Paenibacillus mangrovi]MCJ8013457.1 hypothetical protein [Paenibacillus mangrovi]
MVNQSPILSKVTGVILWSRNLERSVDMYNKLLRLSQEQQERFGHLHIFHLPSGLDIMIDSNGMENVPVPEKASPLFFMPANEIDEAASFVQELGFEIIYGGIHRNEAVSFFNMRDPDFNVITVCQNHR